MKRGGPHLAALFLRIDAPRWSKRSHGSNFGLRTLQRPLDSGVYGTASVASAPGNADERSSLVTAS